MARGDIILPNEDGSALNHAIKNFETRVLHGDVNIANTRERIKRMRITCPTGEGHIPDFFEANVEHEQANELLFNWFFFLAKRAVELKKKPINLTREEVQEAERDFPEMQNLVAYENQAMALYSSSGVRQWDRKLYDVTDAVGLYLGLAYRQAQRILDEGARAKQLDQLDARQLQHFDNIEDFGKRAEYILIWLVRKYARLKRLDHLVSIEHTLTKNDLRDKYDLVLGVAGNVVSVQQKTFSTDSNVAEYNKALLRAQQGKRRPAFVVDLTLDSLEISTLARNEREGNGDIKRKNALITKVADLCGPSGDPIALINRLKDKPAPKPKSELSEKAIKKREREIFKVINLKFLQSIGVLGQGDLMDFNKIAEQTKVVAGVVAELMDAGEIRAKDLKNLESVKEKIQQAIV
jgi:hypothetical protein